MHHDARELVLIVLLGVLEGLVLNLLDGCLSLLLSLLILELLDPFSL